jgi:hypothetical protein
VGQRSCTSWAGHGVITQLQIASLCTGACNQVFDLQLAFVSLNVDALAVKFCQKLGFTRRLSAIALNG